MRRLRKQGKTFRSWKYNIRRTMYPIELSFVEAYLKEKLSYERMLHSKGVADIASKLAEINGVDIEKARIAGLSHDICREWSDQSILGYVKKNNLAICRDVMNMPELAHGPVGAEFLKWKLGIEDKDILDAIASHTIGAPEMSKLQEILFISDFLESTKGTPEADKVMEKASKSLHDAACAVYELKLKYLKSKRIPICPEFIKNMNAFCKGNFHRKAVL